MTNITLADDQALVLQQIDETGGEDFGTLADTLRFDRHRLAQIITALRDKGLLVMSRDGQTVMWLRVSAKGQRLMQYIWPETGLRASHAF